MISEMFNYIALLYMNKFLHVSKVSIYGTLHATFTIFFGITNQDNILVAVFEILIIYTGYALIFIEKVKETKQKKIESLKENVRFVRKIAKETEVDVNMRLLKKDILESEYFQAQSYPKDANPIMSHPS